MKRAAILIVVLVAVVAGGFFAKSYYDMRLSWFFRGGEIVGEAVLHTCVAETPLFLSIFSSEVAASEPLFSSLEVNMSCEAVENNVRSLVANRSGPYQTNNTIYGLIARISCWHPSVSESLSEHCEDSKYSSIAWMLDHGVSLNDPRTCGYLRLAVSEMDERMFDFLLEKGADPFAICPLYSPDSRPNPTLGPNETVRDGLILLLSDLTETEKATVVAPWTRMLETIESLSP